MKIMKNGVVPAITGLIIASSLLLKTPESVPLLGTGFLFLLSVALDRKIKILRPLQFAFLGVFHYYSHLNWSEILYFILILSAVERNPATRPSVTISTLYILEYTAVRMTYVPITTYNVLVAFYDLIAAYLMLAVFRYYLRTERVTKRLQEKTNYLTTHDPLTGFLNHEGYLRAIQQLVNKEHPFVLINLDLQDFKSMNTPGIHSGNDILLRLSSILKSLFRDSFALSRYAGDRFAVALPCKDTILAEIDELLNIQNIGFHLTYSLARFPQEAAGASVLIALAEDRLFQNKRNTWILREEVRFQEEKLRMVGELAAGMAHEIRNPLTTIKGFMQLSKNNEYTMKPWFDLIMSEITRMSELTAEFLQFAKPHISNMKPESVRNCIDRVLFLTESEASLQGHVIIREGCDEELHVLVDRDKIVQVLLNLMRNAFEAMQSGTVQVRDYRDVETCFIEIKDNGSGIPEHELNKIFNPFYTTKENGTGLGLSICKKILQDHGGSLEARSVQGEGSVFTVKLPVHP